MALKKLDSLWIDPEDVILVGTVPHDREVCNDYGCKFHVRVVFRSQPEPIDLTGFDHQEAENLVEEFVNAVNVPTITETPVP